MKVFIKKGVRNPLSIMIYSELCANNDKIVKNKSMNGTNFFEQTSENQLSKKIFLNRFFGFHA